MPLFWSQIQMTLFSTCRPMISKNSEKNVNTFEFCFLSTWLKILYIVYLSATVFLNKFPVVPKLVGSDPTLLVDVTLASH